MALIALWVTLLGCSGDEGGKGDTGDTGDADDPCAPGPNPTLVIGTGDEGFEPITDQVELIHGPQGGYHVFVAFETTHLKIDDDGGDAVIAAEVTGTLDGEIVAQSAPWFALRCNPQTQTQQAWGTLLIYSNGSIPPEELNGEPTTITATLTDTSGASVGAEVQTTIFDPLVE